jgi:hypothetical protein
MFRPLAGLFLAIVLVNTPAHAARIAYFNDPAFIDMSEEGPRLQAALQAEGHTLTLFQGTALTVWQNALAGNDVVVIPEMQVADLFSNLPLDTRFFLSGYVLSGNGLLTIADVNGFATNLLNGMFAFALNFAVPSGASALNGAGVAGTVFAGGPANVPNSLDTSGFLTNSLPPGALPVYSSGGVTSVFVTTVGGRGRVGVLGFDWFETPAPAAWNNVLDRTVNHLEGATTNPQRIAFFEDSRFVDTSIGGEVSNLRTALVPMGHDLHSFVGTSAAEWGAALAQADILLLPENDNISQNLLANLPQATRSLMAEFLLSGGGIVIYADNGNKWIGLLNTILGFSLVPGGSTLNNNFINLTAAAGTAFAGGPPVLPGLNATTTVTTASLPTASKSIYTDGANTSVFIVKRGFGQLISLAYDWFTDPKFPVLSHPWAVALACAIEEATVHSVVPPVTPVPENAGADVSIDLGGFQGLTAATLQVRAGGDAPFTPLTMTQVNPTNWSANIPAAMVTRKGLQGFLELSDGLNPGIFPPRSPASGNFLNIPVSIPGFTFISLPANGYRLAGVPLQAANPDPVAVFDELGAYKKSVWRYGTFDPVAGVYNEPPAAAHSTPGQGFWIIAKDAHDIAGVGTSTNLSGAIDLTLRPGFNQISNPYAFPVDFADVVLPSDVESNLIAFDGSGYLPGITVLNVGTGYWIRNTATSNRTISIPAIGSGVAARPGGNDSQPLRSEEAKVLVRVEAGAGEYHDLVNHLGIRANALEGYDSFDRSEAPVPPEGWVRACFVSDSDGNDVPLNEDWRPEEKSGGASWTLSFASDQSNRSFSIVLEPEIPLPDGWSIAAFDGSREIELGNPARITGVVGSTTAERTWKISVGNAEYLQRARNDAQSSVTTFALSHPFPNPSPSGFAIDLAVPRDVNASARIFDVQGRLVRTMHEGPLDHGVHRLEWNGAENSGQRSAAGVYFLKVNAAEFSTVRKLVLLEKRSH